MLFHLPPPSRAPRVPWRGSACRRRDSCRCNAHLFDRQQSASRSPRHFSSDRALRCAISMGSVRRNEMGYRDFVIGYPLLMRGWVFRRDRTRQPINAPVLIFALCWFAIEAAGVTMQGRMYKYHFLVLAPPAAGLVWNASSKRSAVSAVCGTCVAAIAVDAWLDSPRSGNLFTSAATCFKRLSSVARAPGRSCLGRRDAAASWSKHGLRPGSRYVTTFLWANDDDSATKQCAAMIDDFKQRRPEHIILPSDVDSHVRTYVDGIEELSATRTGPRRTVMRGSDCVGLSNAATFLNDCGKRNGLSTSRRRRLTAEAMRTPGSPPAPRFRLQKPSKQLDRMGPLPGQSHRGSGGGRKFRERR